MREPEHARFEIEGAGLAVRLAGDNEKPALLLIHGFPSSSSSFRNVISFLSRDRFVIAPDLPGRLETQRALVLDYRSHFAQFGEIADYLARWQPSALMLWGRHDAFFDLEETLAWMRALPRMEAHILDGPHSLLETRAAECAELMRAFITNRRGTRTTG